MGEFSLLTLVCFTLESYKIRGGGRVNISLVTQLGGLNEMGSHVYEKINILREPIPALNLLIMGTP